MSERRRDDLLTVAVLFAWAVAEALFVDGPGGRGERLAFAAAFSLPVAAWRRAPIAALLLIGAAMLLRATTSDVDESGTMPFPSLLVTTYAVGRWVDRNVLAVAGGLLALAIWPAAEQFGYSSGDGPEATNYAILAFFVGGAWLAGRVIRARTHGSARAAREAVEAERARIARELHDVVAHGVSVIALQAAAAEGHLTRDPTRAREHLQAVHTTAHQALGELRRLLGVLREADAPYAPQPGLAELDDLVAGTGLPVTVERDDVGELPPGVALATFRIVQEALTNVRKHAGEVATTVRLRCEDGTVAVEIRNAPGRPVAMVPGTGHGLIGMRERAHLYGGSLEAGPDDAGGWVVRARLRIEETTT